MYKEVSDSSRNLHKQPTTLGPLIEEANTQSYIEPKHSITSRAKS